MSYSVGYIHYLEKNLRSIYMKFVSENQKRRKGTETFVYSAKKKFTGELTSVFPRAE
jgi:hypothetical protein